MAVQFGSDDNIKKMKRLWNKVDGQRTLFEELMPIVRNQCLYYVNNPGKSFWSLKRVVELDDYVQEAMLELYLQLGDFLEDVRNIPEDYEPEEDESNQPNEDVSDQAYDGTIRFSPEARQKWFSQHVLTAMNRVKSRYRPATNIPKKIHVITEFLSQPAYKENSAESETTIGDMLQSVEDVHDTATNGIVLEESIVEFLSLKNSIETLTSVLYTIIASDYDPKAKYTDHIVFLEGKRIETVLERIDQMLSGLDINVSIMNCYRKAGRDKDIQLRIADLTERKLINRKNGVLTIIRQTREENNSKYKKKEKQKGGKDIEDTEESTDEQQAPVNVEERKTTGKEKTKTQKPDITD